MKLTIKIRMIWGVKMATIKNQLIPIGTKRRSGKKISKVIFFVDHDTGNADSTAQNNVDYYINSANTMSASAHMFVDDLGGIMCVPCFENAEKAWHVLYDRLEDNKLYGDDANDVAIGMELCYFPNDKIRNLKAYNNYIEIAADLCKFHNVSPTKRSGHFELDPARRSDPNNALKYIGKTYSDMKKDIVAKYNQLYVKQEVKPVESAEKVVSDFAKEAQEWTIKNKISDGTRPKDTVTREEMWTMLYRAYQLNK